MIIIIIGTALGTVIGGIIMQHYLRVWLKKVVKK